MAEKKLTCKQAQARIGKYLTGDEMPAEQVIELEAHVLDCKVCGKVIEDKRNALMSMLNTTEEPEEAEEPEEVEGEAEAEPESEQVEAPEEEPVAATDGGLSAEELELLNQISSMETIHDDTAEPEPEPQPEAAAANSSDVLLSAADLELLNQIQATEAIEDDTPEPAEEALTADDLAFLESIEPAASMEAAVAEPEPTPAQESLKEDFVQISEHVGTDIPELDFSDLDNFVPPSVQEEAEQATAAASEEHDEEEDQKAGVHQLIERFPILVRDNFKLFAMSGALGLVLITMGVFVKNPTRLLGPKAMSSKEEVQKDEKDTSDESETKSSKKEHTEEDTSDSEKPTKKAHDESEETSEKATEPKKETTHEKPEKEAHNDSSHEKPAKEAHKDNIFDSHKADAGSEKPVKLPDDNNADYLTARSNGGVTHTTVKNGKAVKAKPATKPAAKPAAKPAPKPKPAAKPKPAPKPKPKPKAKPKPHVAVHRPKPVVRHAPIRKPKPAPKKHAAAKPAKRNGGIKIYDEGGHEIR